MRIDRLTIPAREPTALSEWYAETLDSQSTDCGRAEDATSTVRLGESSLELTTTETSSPIHVAVRLDCEPDDAVDWLAGEATILPVDGEQSRYFEFLDATAVYFEDPEGNVLEGLCYAGDCQTPESSGLNRVDGITEVGLPAPEPLALVEWLETTVGLSAWGSPSETFAWVGNRDARFVIVPIDTAWYPTDRSAEPVPISVTMSADSADPGRHRHPTLPYEIVVE